jgi:hypothetical protein
MLITIGVEDDRALPELVFKAIGIELRLLLARARIALCVVGIGLSAVGLARGRGERLKFPFWGGQPASRCAIRFKEAALMISMLLTTPDDVAGTLLWLPTWR